MPTVYEALKLLCNPFGLTVLAKIKVIWASKGELKGIFKTIVNKSRRILINVFFTFFHMIFFTHYSGVTNSYSDCISFLSRSGILSFT